MQRNKDQVENKIERMITEVQGRVTRIEEKVAQVETKDVIVQIIDEKIMNTKKELLDLINSNHTNSEIKFDEIFNEHLVYDPIVGNGP